MAYMCEKIDENNTNDHPMSYIAKSLDMPSIVTTTELE